MSLDRLSIVIQSDAEETARDVLRAEFRRLSNRRILRSVKSHPDAARIADEVILEQWFEAYGAAMTRLRRPSSNGPSRVARPV